VAEPQTHHVDREGTKLYLEYLDKEMNIMGILTAFCVATVAFSLKELLEANGNPPPPLQIIWCHGAWYILIGSPLILGAAACFYKQRSNLAWYYGQISLTLAARTVTGTELHDCLRATDAWDTWVPYRSGFFLLWAGLAGYGAAVFGFKFSWFGSPEAIKIYVATVFVLLAVCCRCACILYAGRYEKEPLTLRSFFGLSSEDTSKSDVEGKTNGEN
jgi:hypothetical protein